MKDVKIETIEMDMSEIAEYKSNPRTISKKDFAVLKKSLKDFPSMLDVREIVVDENGVILGGNQRYKGLMALGKTKVKVKRVSGWTDEQKREFVIKDNIANIENGASVGRMAALDWISNRPDYKVAVVLDDDYGGVVSDYTMTPTLNNKTFYDIVKAVWKLGLDLGIETGGYSVGAHPDTKKNIMNVWLISKATSELGFNKILNEDVCRGIYRWHRGKASFGLANVIRSGAQTAEMEKVDGNTKMIYQTDRSYRKSFGAILADPKNAKLSWNSGNTKRGALWHHRVNWADIAPKIILEERDGE